MRSEVKEMKEVKEAKKVRKVKEVNSFECLIRITSVSELKSSINVPLSTQYIFAIDGGLRGVWRFWR